MLRRPPASILNAHRIDSGRRELYVEGTRDRALLRWLASGDLIGMPGIVPIDQVDTPEVDEGGNRERLKSFLLQVEHSGFDIRGFIDADQGRLIDESVPSNAWLTDFRDIESYVLGVENVDAALRLGCGISKGAVEDILDSTFITAEYLAAVRLASYKLGLRLPVSKSELKGLLRVTRFGIVTIDKTRCLTTLLQSARVNLRELNRVDGAVNESASELATKRRVDVIHGKDCMKLLTRQFRALGASNLTDAAPIIWSSFRRERLSDYPALQEVVAYLKRHDS